MKHSDSPAMQAYLNDMEKVPMLSREEEDILASASARGNLQAREKLITGNLRFAFKIAKEYQGKGLDLLDLISEANYGLLRAAEKFDPTRGFHFISYAVGWIRGCIMNALSNSARTIRLPQHKIKQLVKIGRYLRQEMEGAALTSTDIAEIVGLSELEVTDLVAMARPLLSLSTPLHEEESEPLQDAVATDAAHAEVAVFDNVLKDEIIAVLNTLNPTDRAVLQRRYGLNGYPLMSLKEVGELLNVSKERIRQIEKRLIIRLKHPAKNYRLRPFAG